MLSTHGSRVLTFQYLAGGAKMELSDRKKQILAAIIDRYIDTAEPVSSKSIAENFNLGISPATIRNEMAELTTLGLIEQPHTSAGRIPSFLGYRIYVNELMRQHKLSIEETEAINRSLRVKVQQLDKLVSEAGHLVSMLTNYPTYALAAALNSLTVKRFDLIFVDTGSFIIVTTLSNNSTSSKYVNLPFKISASKLNKLSTLFNMHFTGVAEGGFTQELISLVERAAADTLGIVSAVAAFVLSVLSEAKSRQAYIAGASHILELPEYRDHDKAQRLISYLSDPGELLKLPVPDPDAPVKILIGPENVAEALHDSSVVIASYSIDDDSKGLLGVVGPTRMDYSKVAAKLSYIANQLNSLMSGDIIAHRGDENTE